MSTELLGEIRAHHGEFLCELIGSEKNTKLVKFSHIIDPAEPYDSVPNVGGLQEFYNSAASLTLYFCEESGEAAFFIASPGQWESLESEFEEWVDMLDEDEQDDALPDWFESHKVIGEIPSSGNYILVVTGGPEAGSIYEFEHDGFEFIELGSSFSEFIFKALDPDPGSFTSIASHMRFITDSPYRQWWARELRHNHGKIVVNDA